MGCTGPRRWADGGGASGRAIVIGRGAWLFELDARRVWPLAPRVPWFHVNQFRNADDPLANVFPASIPDNMLRLNAVFASNHYGLLVHTTQMSGKVTTFRAESPTSPGGEPARTMRRGD